MATATLTPLDIAAWRKQYLANVDPSKLAGLDTSPYEQAVLGAYQKAGQGLASVGLDEETARTNYENSIAQNLNQRLQAQKSLAGSMADRGLTFSSAYTNRLADVNKDYDTQYAQLGTNRDQAVANAAMRRAGLIGDYESQSAQLGANLAGQASTYLQNLLSQEAAAAAQKPVAPAPVAAPKPVVQAAVRRTTAPVLPSIAPARPIAPAKTTSVGVSRPQASASLGRKWV